MIVITIISLILLNSPLHGENHTQFVDFETAMKPSNDFPGTQDPQWGVLKKLYESNVINANFEDAPKIPKIIHHIWLGSPLPERCRQLRESWIKHHPDWQFILWTDKDIETFGLENKSIYLATPNYGSRSDIARYEILYRIGGLYIDTDFECLKSFDFFHHSLHFYCGATYDRQASMFNGLIGSAPGNPILFECIRSMRSNNGAREGTEQIMHRTGPYHLTNCFFKVIHSCTDAICVFPVTYFYPWPHFVKQTNPQSWVKDESYAIHHWHVSWRC